MVVEIHDHVACELHHVLLERGGVREAVDPRDLSLAHHADAVVVGELADVVRIVGAAEPVEAELEHDLLVALAVLVGHGDGDAGGVLVVGDAAEADLFAVEAEKVVLGAVGQADVAESVGDADAVDVLAVHVQRHLDRVKVRVLFALPEDRILERVFAVEFVAAGPDCERGDLGEDHAAVLVLQRGGDERGAFDLLAEDGGRDAEADLILFNGERDHMHLVDAVHLRIEIDVSAEQVGAAVDAVAEIEVAAVRDHVVVDAVVRMDDDLVFAGFEAVELHGERGVAAAVRVEEVAVQGDFGGLADLLELDDVVFFEVGFLQVERVAVVGVAAFERDRAGAVRCVHGVGEGDRSIPGVAGALEVERLDLLHGCRDGLDPGRGGVFDVIADASLVHGSGEHCGGAEEGEGGESAAEEM